MYKTAKHRTLQIKLSTQEDTIKLSREFLEGIVEEFNELEEVLEKKQKLLNNSPSDGMDGGLFSNRSN